MKKDTYDIVICGSGAAGLLLALRLHQNPFFKDYSVLLIDAAFKNTNDRTWCFWEKQQGPLEAIVHHRWEHGLFKSPSFTQDLYLNPYTYKMIRGIDFYNHILPQLQANPQFDFLNTKINSIETQNTQTTIHTNEGTVLGHKFSQVFTNRNGLQNSRNIPFYNNTLWDGLSKQKIHALHPNNSPLWILISPIAMPHALCTFCPLQLIRHY